MIRIHSFGFRGRTVWTLFSTGYVRRLNRHRRFVLRPGGGCTMHDNLTPEEIGQLLGGN